MGDHRASAVGKVVSVLQAAFQLHLPPHLELNPDSDLSQLQSHLESEMRRVQDSMHNALKNKDLQAAFPKLQQALSHLGSDDAEEVQRGKDLASEVRNLSEKAIGHLSNITEACDAAKVRIVAQVYLHKGHHDDLFHELQHTLDLVYANKQAVAAIDRYYTKGTVKKMFGISETQAFDYLRTLGEVFYVAVCADSTIAVHRPIRREKMLPANRFPPAPKGWLEGEASTHVVAFSPDGTLLACGQGQAVSESDVESSWFITVWDLGTQLKLGTLSGHTGDLKCFAWSRDGAMLASCGMDMTVKIWDTRTLREKATLKGHYKGVTCCAWNHEGSLLASISEDETVRIWDTATMKSRGKLRLHTICGAESQEWDSDFSGVYSVAWGADGTLRCVGRDVTVWDVKTLERKACIDLSGASHNMASIAWSHNASRVASGHCDHLIYVWTWADNAIHKEQVLGGHSLPVTCVAWSRDGKMLASGSEDKTVKIWDTSTMKELGTLRGHEDIVCSVSWSYDGSLLSTGSWTSDGCDHTVKIWDPHTKLEMGGLHRFRTKAPSKRDSVSSSTSSNGVV